MKLKTKVSAIFYGIFCFLPLLLFIYGVIKNDFGSILVSSICFFVFLPLFIIFYKMIGNIYCENNKIIKERFKKPLINIIDENLNIVYGIFSIKIVNKCKQYLNREDDENGVIENIYRYIENKIIENALVLPYTYKRDNYFISLLFIAFGALGFMVYVILIVNNVIVDIVILILAILCMAVSFVTFLPKRKIVFETDKIIIINAVNIKKEIPRDEIIKTEILSIFKKLTLYIYCRNGKFFIELNKKSNCMDIKNMYSLEKFYRKDM